MKDHSSLPPIALHEALRPMSEALKNGKPVLARMKDPIPRPGRDDLERWNGIWVVIRHHGVASDGFDGGWQVAAPVGSGGLPDDWFDGWAPLPPQAAHPLDAPSCSPWRD